jgi:4,5-DOPA dioxygenase extradiol
VKVPPIFVSYGTPGLALDRAWGAELAAWARSLPRPRGILAIGAEWHEAVPTRGSTAARPATLHDDDANAFPSELAPELAAVRYPAPGAPELAYELHALAPIARAEGRGRDHGVWCPLLHMYPDADIPVLQLSLVLGASPRRLYGLGRRIGVLAERGYLLMGSGAITDGHTAIGEEVPVDDRARAFDAWVANALADAEMEALLAWRAKAPHARQAHPAHARKLDPLFVIAGAASLYDHAVGFPVRGFDHGTVSRRSVQFGR